MLVGAMIAVRPIYCTHQTLSVRPKQIMTGALPGGITGPTAVLWALYRKYWLLACRYGILIMDACAPMRSRHLSLPCHNIPDL